MIHKNAQYGAIEGVTLAKFGNGTISICSATTPGKKKHSLLLKSHEPMPIGDTGMKYDTSDDFKPELVIQFSNRESFDVFFETVLEVKQFFDDDDNAEKNPKG